MLSGSPLSYVYFEISFPLEESLVSSEKKMSVKVKARQESKVKGIRLTLRDASWNSRGSSCHACDGVILYSTAGKFI